MAGPSPSTCLLGSLPQFKKCASLLPLWSLSSSPSSLPPLWPSPSPPLPSSSTPSSHYQIITPPPAAPSALPSPSSPPPSSSLSHHHHLHHPHHHHHATGSMTIITTTITVPSIITVSSSSYLIFKMTEPSAVLSALSKLTHLILFMASQRTYWYLYFTDMEPGAQRHGCSNVTQAGTDSWDLNQSSHTLGSVPLRDIQMGIICYSKILETTQIIPIMEDYAAV